MPLFLTLPVLTWRGDSTDIAVDGCPHQKKSPPTLNMLSSTHPSTPPTQQTHHAFKNITIRSAEVRATQHPGIGAVPLRARVGEAH
jgi:hypothetical protein